MQEGKSAGLGAIAGAADTYWGKNKGRSMEGRLVTGTKIPFKSIKNISPACVKKSVSKKVPSIVPWVH